MKRKNRHLFFMCNSFSKNSGGRTQATINRAKMLSSHTEKCFILTNNFKVDYGKIVEYVKKKRSIPESIEFLNIYEFFAGEAIYLTNVNRENIFEKSPKLTYEYIQDNNGYKVLDKGKQVSYIQLDKNDVIKYKDFFDFQKRKEKRETYDALGNIIKISYYDMKTKKIIRRDFYTRRFFCI